MRDWRPNMWLIALGKWLRFAFARRHEEAKRFTENPDTAPEGGVTPRCADIGQKAPHAPPS